MRQSARMTGSKNYDHRASQAKAAFGRSFCLAVPELTRSTGIQFNARLSLRRPRELLTLSQSCGLADAASSGHAYRAIRGRCCVIEGSGPAQSCSGGKLNDAATQLDPRDRDGRMLDNLARNSSEFRFCG